MQNNLSGIASLIVRRQPTKDKTQNGSRIYGLILADIIPEGMPNDVLFEGHVSFTDGVFIMVGKMHPMKIPTESYSDEALKREVFEGRA